MFRATVTNTNDFTQPNEEDIMGKIRQFQKGDIKQYTKWLLYKNETFYRIYIVINCELVPANANRNNNTLFSDYTESVSTVNVFFELPRFDTNTMIGDYGCYSLAKVSEYQLQKLIKGLKEVKPDQVKKLTTGIYDNHIDGDTIQTLDSLGMVNISVDLEKDLANLGKELMGA